MPARLRGEIWTATKLLDRLGLYTVQSYQKGREAIISRQSDELLELSTPVIHL
jgi:rsbT co-antagonist protein RsbR